MRFCPKCAGSLRLQTVPGDMKDRLVCQSCEFVFYQDPKVASCTIPVFGGGILLVRRAVNPGWGRWVFPGGYMERDETVEEAAIRETREEVNLDVRLTRLVGVYSYRTPVVVVVYACDVLGGQIQINHESLEARTFLPQEIPWQELAFPSTRDGLRDFLACWGNASQGFSFHAGSGPG